MRSSKQTNGYTQNQIGALVTLGTLVIWSAVQLWIHLFTLAGADMFEIIFLGTLTAVFLVLLPLYGKRVRWAYVGGILVVVAMLVGAVKAGLDHSYFFSWSLYNLLVILAYVVALACAYFSVRSFREIPSTGTVRTALGIGGIVLAAAVIAVILSSQSERVHTFMFQQILNRVDNRLQRLETLDEQIEFLLDVGDIDSAAVGIVVNDSLAWAQAYGETELDTLYNIGSVTKPVAAAAILQLYERDLIDLDADANEYLPFSLRHPDYPDTPITIRLLLTHQSSLAHFTDLYMAYHMDNTTIDWLTDKRGWDLPRFDSSPPLGEFMESYLTVGGAYYTPDAWLSQKPGSGYAYSTIGYDLLAYIVENVTGQSFAEYAHENIFAPLGMTGSGFSVAGFPGRVAVPYEKMYGVLSKTNLELPLTDVRTLGGGGMLSTVPDMAQFMIALMNQGQANGFQLLQPETVALMHKRAVSFPLGYGDLNQVSYGLGLGHIREQPWQAWNHLYDMHGATGHGGSWFGYQGQMWFVNGEKGSYGIILLVNTEFDFKAEARNTWIFASPLKLQVLLMEEASEFYGQMAAGR
jgi:CubicO group peptidase (beta-lactamase class C family)